MVEKIFTLGLFVLFGLLVTNNVHYYITQVLGIGKKVKGDE